MLTKKTLLGLVFGLLVTGMAAADTVKLRSDHPDRYVVAKGDTLWDIAGKFLDQPWQWPEIWHINPAIENPHLIYPGDIIVLSFTAEGKPVLSVQRDQRISAGKPVKKLSPQVRVTEIERAIPTIMPGVIKPFLEQPRVLSKNEYEAAPYIVAGEEHRLVMGESNHIFVRDLDEQQGTRYSVVHIGDAYRNPGEKRILGYEAIHVGDAVVEEFGDPATLRIVESRREALLGDRLLPISEQPFEEHFLPRAPQEKVNGSIIGVRDAVSRVGRHQVVVINLGTGDGMEPGHVLAVYQTGDEVRDVVKGGQVTLPARHAGNMMVFRTFDNVSYALIMEAFHDIRLHDMVRNP